MPQSNRDFRSMTEEEYDLHRLPNCISKTVHHIDELEREILNFRARSLPGDSYRAAKNAWYIRNNRNYLESCRKHLRELGGSPKVYQLDLFQVVA